MERSSEVPVRPILGRVCGLQALGPVWKVGDESPSALFGQIMSTKTQSRGDVGTGIPA